MSKSSYKKVIALGLDYSEFQGGIKECTSEMKKLDAEYKDVSSSMAKSASKSDQLAEKNEYLTKKIQLQTKKVELAKEKYDQLVESQASTSAINKAAAAYHNEQAQLNQLNNEMSDTIVAQSGLQQSCMALAAVFGIIAAAARECITSVADYADEIGTLSAQTGVAVETLQGWDYASELIDVSLDTMTSAFQKLEKSMASNPQAFRELGVAVTDSSGQMRNAEDVFMDTIDALGRIDNATEQDQMAMEIFGKSAVELTGMIDAGSEGLKAYSQEAQALGHVLTDEQVQACSQASDAIYRMNESFEAAKNQIGASLAPIIIAVCDAIAKIPTPVMTAVIAIASLAAVIVTLTMAISSVKAIFVAFSAVIAATTSAMLPQLAIIAAIIAAIALLAVAIKEIIELYKEWKKEQEEVAKMKTPEVHSSGGSSYHGGGGHYRAKGGTVQVGEDTTWVGENGPELVSLPAGSRVYTNNESKQIVGGTTYNINMNCDLSRMKTVNDVINAVQGLQVSAGCM